MDIIEQAKELSCHLGQPWLRLANMLLYGMTVQDLIELSEVQKKTDIDLFFMFENIALPQTPPPLMPYMRPSEGLLTGKSLFGR